MNLSSKCITIFITVIFNINFAIASILPIYDFVEPGQTVKFWWTNGPNPNENAVEDDTKVEISDDGGETWTDVTGFFDMRNDGFTSSATNTGRINLRFTPVNSEGITDWHQEIVSNGTTIIDIDAPATEIDGIGITNVMGTNLINDGSSWVMASLLELPSTSWIVPDLAPIFGVDPNLTIYTAVNFNLYLQHNPFGFLNGEWNISDTLNDLNLSITNGVISGLEGIYWSTSEFVFDPNLTGFGFTPSGGVADLLNSDSFGQPIGIVAQHASVPEPSFFTLMLIGGWFFLIFTNRKSKSCPDL